MATHDLTVCCIITEVYRTIALNLMRLNLYLILSMFKVAWFLTSSYYWMVNQKLVATCMQLVNGRSLTVSVLVKLTLKIVRRSQNLVAHVLVALSEALSCS